MEKPVMSHPYYHAVSSAKIHGGKPEDYLPIHNFFDSSKQSHPDFRHRALYHHTHGIFLVEQIFGTTITNSCGREIAVRIIGEQHVMEDMGRIPTAADWLTCIQPEPWMNRSRKLSQELAAAS